MITGQEPHRISSQAQVFLWGKCVYQERENDIVISIYGFKGKPLFLPRVVLDGYFVAEVFIQYHDWLAIFGHKNKKQFISLPFFVG